jgi:hypothetical protein
MEFRDQVQPLSDLHPGPQNLSRPSGEDKGLVPITEIEPRLFLLQPVELSLYRVRRSNRGALCSSPHLKIVIMKLRFCASLNGLLNAWRSVSVASCRLSDMRLESGTLQTCYVVAPYIEILITSVWKIYKIDGEVKGALRSVVIQTLYNKQEGWGFETRRVECISIYLILPGALGPGVYSASNIN